MPPSPARPGPGLGRRLSLCLLSRKVCISQRAAHVPLGARSSVWVTVTPTPLGALNGQPRGLSSLPQSSPCLVTLGCPETDRLKDGQAEGQEAKAGAARSEVTATSLGSLGGCRGTTLLQWLDGRLRR